MTAASGPQPRRIEWRSTTFGGTIIIDLRGAALIEIKSGA